MSSSPHPTSPSNGLLGPDDPPPCEVLRAPGDATALLVCDHAAARMPGRLGTLGLPPAALADHIALDIGAAAVARDLAGRLGLPAVLTNYSRLVVDCNRRLDDPTAFPERSDGIEIPGNMGLGTAARQARADALYWPYHHTVRDRLAALEVTVAAPALIAIHSFTPVFGGQRRPWHVGILWDQDPRIPVPLMRSLAADGDVVVGDNEPYSGRHPADFTVDHHAEAEGLPYVSIEIRQDLITTSTGAAEWADRLAEALAPILGDRDLYVHWSGH
jgi:predicted N-formylglutamate amidohydrolase